MGFLIWRRKSRKGKKRGGGENLTLWIELDNTPGNIMLEVGRKRVKNKFRKVERISIDDRRLVLGDKDIMERVE